MTEGTKAYQQTCANYHVKLLLQKDYSKIVILHLKAQRQLKRVSRRCECGVKDKQDVIWVKYYVDHM